jgi:hypothetical protein
VVVLVTALVVALVVVLAVALVVVLAVALVIRPFRLQGAKQSAGL